MSARPDDHYEVTSRQQWRRWLEKNHARSAGVWLVTFKKSAGPRHVPYAAAVEEALCFGWIDSKPGRVDAGRTKLWFTPRRRGTGWSRLNKERIAALLAGGRMAEAGREKVAAAQADGSWNLLDDVENLAVPDDLAAAFRDHPGSAEHFAAFPPSARRGILDWIRQARRPETRAKRIAETASLAARGERANQWTRPR